MTEWCAGGWEPEDTDPDMAWLKPFYLCACGHPAEECDGCDGPDYVADERDLRASLGWWRYHIWDIPAANERVWYDWFTPRARWVSDRQFKYWHP